jgi:hypothetical protein
MRGERFVFFLTNNPILLLGVLGVVYTTFQGKLRFDVSILSTTIIILLLNAFYFLATNVFLYHYLAFFAPFLSLFLGYLLTGIRTVNELQKVVLSSSTVFLLILGFSTTAFVFAIEDYEGYEMYSDMVEVLSQSPENSTLINFMFYNPMGRIAAYISFLTGREIPPNYIDSSLQRITFSVDEEDFENTIRGSDFVLWEIKNRRNQELGNFREILYYIKEELYPVYLNFFRGDIFIISSKKEPEPQELDFYPLLKADTRKYEITYLKDEQYERAIITRLGNNTLASLRTDPAFAPFHTGGTVKLVARDHPVLPRPLRTPSHWRTNESGLVSDSYVLWIKNNSARIVTITFDEKTDEHVSLIVVDFDSELRTWSTIDTYYYVKKSDDISQYVSVYSEKLLGGNVINQG